MTRYSIIRCHCEACKICSGDYNIVVVSEEDIMDHQEVIQTGLSLQQARDLGLIYAKLECVFSL